MVAENHFTNFKQIFLVRLPIQPHLSITLRRLASEKVSNWRESCVMKMTDN